MSFLDKGRSRCRPHLHCMHSSVPYTQKVKLQASMLYGCGGVRSRRFVMSVNERLFRTSACAIRRV